MVLEVETSWIKCTDWSWSAIVLSVKYRFDGAEMPSPFFQRNFALRT